MANAAIRCIHASVRTDNVTVGSSAEGKKGRHRTACCAVRWNVKLLIPRGARGEIRTPDLLVRSQTLYPTELRAHALPRQTTKRGQKLQVLRYMVRLAYPFSRLVRSSAASVGKQKMLSKRRLRFFTRSRCQPDDVFRTDLYLTLCIQSSNTWEGSIPRLV
jgi:hypothetical protein